MTINSTDDTVRAMMKMAHERNAYRLKFWTVSVIAFFLAAALCGLLVGVLSSSSGAPAWFDAQHFSGGQR